VAGDADYERGGVVSDASRIDIGVRKADADMTCDGCGKPIAEGEVYKTLTTANGVQHWHGACASELVDLQGGPPIWNGMGWTLYAREEMDKPCAS
jgi:hypothetical protein